MKQQRSFALRVVCAATIAMVGVGSFFEWGIFTRPCVNEEHLPREIFGIVQSDPYKKKNKWIVDIASPFLGDRKWCRLRAYTYEDIAHIQYADTIALQGDIELPKPFDSFNYPAYLKVRDIHFIAFQSTVQQVSKNKSFSLKRALFWVRRFCIQRLEQAITPPHVDILSAMMFGQRQALSTDMKEMFAAVGASHILAISGLHMTLITANISGFLLRSGLHRRLVFWALSIFLCFYVLLVGAPSSAVRAGSMSFLVLLVTRFGRAGNGINALFLIAAILCVWNPYSVLHDVGYQLSFSATLGILIFMKHIQKILKRIKIPTTLGIRDGLAMTIAATLTTWPLVLYHFHYLSYMSIAANLILVPILPFLFLFGFLTLLFGSYVAPPLWLLLEYMIRMTEWLSHFTKYPAN